MRHHRNLLAAFALSAAAACGSGTEPAGDDVDPGEDGGVELDEWDDRLADREVDYSAALRIAALRLTGELPTLVEVKAVGDSPTTEAKKAVYESLLRGYLDDPRFARQIFGFWQDTLKLGGDAEFDSAAAFAASITVEGRPYTDMLTASTGTCATYDTGAGTFTPVDCDNGAAAHAGLLTHPGMHRQFFSNMAFRRVRWIQETFACTAFPAEIGAPQDLGGNAVYTGTWPFESIAGADNGGRVDFHDLSAVACANCHVTMNHIAPLLLNFDEDGQDVGTPAVLLPTEGTPLAAVSDYLPPGETTAWRLGVPAADLPALGAAMAADPLIADCAIARTWNWAMGKGDIVETLAVIPSNIIATQVESFRAGNYNLKDAIFDVFTSDDFVKF